MTRRRLPILAALLLGAFLPALWLVNARIPRPTHLGAHDGRLAPCPDSPNCVSSQSTRTESRVAPLPFSGPAESVPNRLKATLGRLPRTTLVREEPGYLHYEFRTLLCRYVDDVEFLVDGTAQVIHVRSASRLGYSDLGANRKRVETLRLLWQTDANGSPSMPRTP